MSSDGFVVISHDPSTKRVFGSNGGLIKKRPYIGDLDRLLTVRLPHEKMPLLREVLELFISNANFDDKRLVIDVKADNEVGIIEGIAKAMKEIKDDFTFWNSRIVLGIWMVCIASLLHIMLLLLTRVGQISSVLRKVPSSDTRDAYRRQHMVRP
jgi:phosphatidylglycerol phospholipase C